MKNFALKIKKNRASTLIVILFVVSIIFILALAYLSLTGQRRAQSKKFGTNVVAFYLAEAGVSKAVSDFKEQFNQPLVKNNNLNDDRLNLLDIDKASTYTRTFDVDDLIMGGTVHVTVQILNIKGTPFYCFIGEKEKVPPRLNIYKKTSDELYENKSLGGWKANLKIISTANYEGTTRKIEVIKDVISVNCSPPAPEYNLFVWGRNAEVLRYGEFILSNWDFSETIGSIIKPLMKEVGDAFDFSSLDADDNESNEGALQGLQDFVSKSNNINLQNKINQVIMKMNPWAKIRTNGELQVYLPFFEVDDIINYFVDNRFAEMPEIGYVNCNNRLHDRFMGKYTRYEGMVQKYYFELRPYISNRQKKRDRHKQYTLFSTRRRYPQQNPKELMPRYYETICKNIMKYSNILIPKNSSFFGTSAKPINIQGLMTCEDKIRLGGVYKGQGIVFSEKGDIYISGSLIAADEDSQLSIIAPKGRILLPSDGDIILDASCCCQNSILRGRRVVVNGSLVVENLNRDKGTPENSMPPVVNINYDARVRNVAADNVRGFISSGDITWRELHNK